MDPYKRLAAAVILKAIEDVAVYHSEEGVRCRKALKEMAGKTTEARYLIYLKYGFNRKSMGFRTLRDVCLSGDPLVFLKTETPFHVALGLDPEQFALRDYRKLHVDIRKAMKSFGGEIRAAKG